MQRCRIVLLLGLLALSSLEVAAQTSRSTQECFKRGMARYEKGDYTGALDDYTRAIELSSRLGQPKPAGDWRTVADGRKASEFDGVRVLDPLTAQAYANRGLVRFRLGDYEGAVQDCNRALAIEPRLRTASSEL